MPIAQEISDIDIGLKPSQVILLLVGIFFIDYLSYRKSSSDSVQMLLINGFILIHGYIHLRIHW